MVAATESQPPRKPTAAEGDRRPAWMIELGIEHFTAVPDPVLDHWSSREFPAKLRIMAFLVRHSWGFRSACCIIEDRPGKPRRPMQQSDLVEHLELSAAQVSKTVHELVSDRLLRLEGRTLFTIPDPSQAPLPQLVRSPEQAQAPEITDPEYLADVQAARAEYTRILNQARAQLQHRLDSAKLRCQARQSGKVAVSGKVARSGKIPPLRKVAGIDNEKLPEMTTFRGDLNKEDIQYIQATSGWVGVEPPTATPPTHPLPGGQQALLTEAQKYLAQFTRQVGKAPDLKITMQVCRRLESATLEQLETLRAARCAAGLQITSYGIFLDLAADCAASKEAFEAAPAASARSREQQQAEEYAKRRHARQPR